MPTMTDAAANKALADQGALFVQLHTADPTDAGTAAVSVGLPTRVAAALSVAAGRARTNPADIAWPAGTTVAETITHLSLWTAATGGACQWRGPLVAAKPVALGEKFKLAAGDLDLTID